MRIVRYALERLPSPTPGRVLPQSLAPLQHTLRLLEQAARDGRAVPWVLFELVGPPAGALAC